MARSTSRNTSRSTNQRLRGPVALVAALLVAAAAWLGGSGIIFGADTPHQVSGPISERQVSYTTWDAERYPEYYRVVGEAV